jgi:pimeloyl-ACP methyl ester carboxylesterase
VENKSLRCATDARRRLALAVLLILSGSFLAHYIQTSGGSVRIQDVRFAGTNGHMMSALLYIPRSATRQTPAPAVLAVHGYFNSREVQGDFAIEFARRGYVVLALDQTGHGYSDPPAFANQFGGPDGLAYLRSLDFVDKKNIGLEGHSMGGWTVVNAAAAVPDGYRAIVLEGSSTGRPFAPDGTPQFPRNLAVVFSRLDEFSQIMWGVDSAGDVSSSRKLWRVFDTDQPVIPGRLYGSVAAGTARMLYTPPGTHPMDHISPAAIGASIDWFQRTLAGGSPKVAADQVWPWRELGTFVALTGFVVLLLGTFELLLAIPCFADLATSAPISGRNRDSRWWAALLIGSCLPAITLLPFFQIGSWLLPASHWLPQAFTNEVVTWAALNGLLVLGLQYAPGTPHPTFNIQLWRSAAIALLTVAVGYIAVAAVDFMFKADFRIWFIAFKLMSHAQARAFAVYFLPLAFYFVVSLRALHSVLPVRTRSIAGEYFTNVGALTLGIALFLIVQYGSLVTTHHLLTLYMNDALRVIIAINFIPLLSIVAIISTFAFRRTNSYLPGALISALLVAWYAVVGQATQWP